MSTKSLQILNIIGFMLVLVLNGLATALPINGLNTGEISDLYPNLFVPAGFTFSIWGIIYLLQLAFIIYQSRALFKSEGQVEEIQIIGIWYFISSLANASWILAWHFLQVELSFVLMLVLLTSLIMIYTRLQIGTGLTISNGRRYWVHLPFSVYLGWITVATIANTTTLLVDWNLSGLGLGEAIWTAIMISIATLIGLYFLWKKRDIPYTLVLVWAFFGIAAARSNQLILTVVYIGIGLLVLGIIWQLSSLLKAKS